MNAFLQYQYIQTLTNILLQAESISHKEIAGIALRELIENGLGYERKEGKIVTAINGKEYRFSSSLLDEAHTGSMLYTEQRDVFDSAATPFASSVSQAEAERPDTDWLENLAEAVPEANNEPVSEASQILDDILNSINMDGTSPVDDLSIGDGSDMYVPPVSPVQAEPYKPEPYEPKSFSSPLSVEAEEDANTDPFVGFGRASAAVPPSRRTREKEEASDQEEQTGFLPPLTGAFVSNYDIALKDCVYSMFVGEIYEETALKKHKIYFMVAPFEIKENESSTNIILYAFYNGQSYAVTSLSNKNKNSLLCQIAEYQFLVRGKFSDWTWSAEIQLTGESLKRRDVFKIEKEHHNNPASIGTTNGHIRFTYKGHVNHKELVSKGCVNIFPVDSSSGEYIVVRCIEDFIDIIFTEDTKEIDLHEVHGDKKLTVETANGTVRAVITDAVEEEEVLFE